MAAKVRISVLAPELAANRLTHGVDCSLAFRFRERGLSFSQGFGDRDASRFCRGSNDFHFSEFGFGDSAADSARRALEFVNEITGVERATEVL